MRPVATTRGIWNVASNDQGTIAAESHYSVLSGEYLPQLYFVYVLFFHLREKWTGH